LGKGVGGNVAKLWLDHHREHRAHRDVSVLSVFSVVIDRRIEP